MDIIKGFFMAWGTFCRVPCPCKVWDEKLRKEMLLMLPALGLLMGGVWYALTVALIFAEIPLPLVAAVLTVYPFLISGFIHLDGFMDCSDAICSRAPVERRIEILKDPHNGSFATAWTVVVFLVFYAAVWSWLASGMYLMTMMIVMAAPRAVSASFVLGKPSLKTSLYKNMTDKKAAIIPIVSLLLAAILFVLMTGFVRSVVVIVVCTAVSFLAEDKAVRNLGGMSGDISGYGIVWGELAAVITAAVIF